jgi:hypothetical protein
VTIYTRLDYHAQVAKKKPWDDLIVLVAVMLLVVGVAGATWVTERQLEGLMGLPANIT